MSENKNILHVENIGKKYGNKIILENIYFDISEGEFVSILGSSGCGKTTLLRILVGIESPSYGTIFKYGEDITNKTPYERNIGIVFQNYALFPNMNVYDNIAYALKARKVDKNEIKERVDNIIEMMGLSDHVNKKPRQLSGGQQQRVAIARALNKDSNILLCDEPTGALDDVSGKAVLKLLEDIHNEGKTIVLVTHTREIAQMANRIITMKNGKVISDEINEHIVKAEEVEW